MNYPSEVLQQLETKGIEVFLDGGTLKAKARKGALDAAAVQLIKDNKQQLIDYLNQHSAAGGGRPNLVAMARSGNRLPPSFAQRRLWFLDQLEGGSAHYNMPAALRVAGRFDAALAGQALGRIVARHEPLRTVFARDGEQLVQVIREQVDVGVPVVDLAHLPQAERERAARELALADAAAPFDLAHDPMLRASYVRLGEDEGMLLFNMHHIASDGWSMGLLVREFTAQYQALRDGRPDPFGPLAVTYADYAQWQRDYLAGPVLQEQLGYWEGQLAGLPPVHSLPLDRPRPPQQGFRGARHRFTLDRDLHAGLKRLAQERGATLFMVLHAALSVLLARHGNSADIVVGTPVANRLQKELEEIIGFFVNTLVLRTDVSGNPRFDAFLDQVKAVNLDAQSRQDVPFEYLVERLNPARSTQYGPLFQIMFSMGTELAEDGRLQLDDVAFAPIENLEAPAKYDLLFEARETPAGLACHVDYNVDLFDAATVGRLAAHYARLLGAIVAAPATPVQDLPLLDEEERHYLLHTLNATATGYPDRHCIHELFEEQAARTPEQVALVCEGQALSYRELNRRANQLAHCLIERGVAADTLVALHVERGIGMVVGVLGILKAGGAYVPLDPAYPDERLVYMLEDARPALVLTEAALRERLAPGTPLLCLDDGQTLAGYPCANPQAPVRPQHLAYVIYTSGSTGRPKGVAVAHRGACNLAACQQAVFGVRADSRVLGFASLSFDAATFEWIMALLRGAAFYVATGEQRRDVAALQALLVEQRITHATLPPALLPHLDSAAAYALQTLVLAGEACGEQAVAPWLARCRVFNAYGPTEATVWSSTARLERGQAVTIGRPIANTRMYVLDERRAPVPVGVPGELYLGGVGLARGYLGRPGLTAERFVPDPFGAPGSRLYRTGDLARILADGRVDFLGRADDQVKIRGLRIELGEIESRLLGAAGVREAVVAAREDSPGEKRLAAYVVPESGAGLAPAQLSEWLRAALPEYMVPSAWMVLEALPLTPNGKVDRKALPAPQAAAQAGYVAPSTPTEAALAAIWAELLQRESGTIGAHDNFFALGGHSLLVVKLLAAMQEAGLSADAQMVFSAESLAVLAAGADAAAPAASAGFAAPPNRIPPGCEHITPDMLPLVELDAGAIGRIVVQVPGGAANVQDIYPLAPLQEGLYFHHLMHREDDPYVLNSLYAVDTDSRLAALMDGLRKVIARHDVLRTAILSEQLPAPVQVVYRCAELRLDMIAPDAGDDPVAALRRVCGRPMDLARAPALRVAAVRDPGSERHFLAIQLHHIAADHTGLEIIYAELERILAGHANGLPEPAPYREFVAHALHQARHNDAREYFERVLGDVTEPTAPFNVVDVHGNGSAMEELRRTLDPALAGQVRALARQRRVSPATLFHAAWALVVATCSAREDIVFGTVLSGRLQGGAGAQSMGMFINTLPLRLKLDGLSVEQLVAQAESALLGLLPYEQASLSLAQRCSGVAPEVPLFSALINYRHSDTGQPERAGTYGIALIETRERTNYPLVALVDDLGEGFSVAVQASHGIAPARVLAYLEHALEGIAQALQSARPTPLRELAVLPQAEREMLAARARSRRSDECGLALHELFEQQVLRTPDHVAVVFEGSPLSYRELNRRANRLAHCLRSRGAGPDRLVGICAERGLEMIVALLGVLKAGAAYVPLDPDYPDERLAYMVGDSAMPLLVTQARLAKRARALAADRALDVIALDAPELADSLMAQPDGDPGRVPGQGPDNLAYVIYTSGSTGLPKGVLVEHRNVTRLFSASAARFGFGDRDVWTLFHSFGFDFSVWEIWGALLHGGRLVVVPQMVARSAPDFYELVQREQVTVLNQTPRAFDLLVAVDGERRAPLALRHVIFGGEALNVAALRPWAARRGVDTPQLVNMYGITETTVHVTYRRLFESDIWSVDNPSVIGEPLEDLCALVLTARQDLAPDGAAGELYIGGAGLARGYLNRAELTRERFVPNPFEDGVDPAGDARLYRTGDLVRRLPDGSLEYLGRIDDQVKIRGFRIELGEIESRLVQHDAVAAAAVIAREDNPGDRRLVAYVSPGPGAVAGPELVDVLRRHLGASLPGYMVPAAFVLLDSLPLTRNGKVDRQALPAPDSGMLSHEYAAPRTGTECQLAAIWCQLLGVERVGIHDNFFELGGHSLLLVQLLSAMQQAGMRCDVRTIYEAASLEALAANVEATTGTGQEAVGAPPNRIPAGCTRITPEMLSMIELEQADIDRIVATVPGGAANVQDIYPLAPLQEGMYFHHLLHRDRDPYVLPSLCEVDTREQFDALMAALERVVARHDVLRTAILSDNLPRPVQVVYRRVRLQVAMLEPQDGVDIPARLAAYFDRPMDLAAAPMLRICAVEDPHPGKLHVLFQAHHLVEDVSSWLLLGAELAACLAGTLDDLPAPVPYREFVAHTLLQAGQHDAEAYFSRTLGDLTEPTAPFNLLDVHEDGRDTVERRKTLDSRLAEEIRDAARRRKLSPATLFHAAWALVVGSCSARDDVVFGTVLSGRLQGTAGARNTIGMFINTLPLRLKLAGIGVEQLVAQAASALRELLPYEHASLPMAQRCSGLRGNLPLFSAMLNYRHSQAQADTAAYGVKLIAARERTNYPLVALVDDLDEGFSVAVQATRGIAPERVLGYLEQALAGIVEALREQPHKAALEVALLPAEEREQLLVAWNRTAHAYEHEQTLHGLFEAQARRTPAAVAAVFEGESLTYAGLDARSNRLAAYLRDQGVGAESLVVVCLERSLEMVVALLGILKAGGAYVPLDPGYPRERLAHMLEDAAPAVLLTQASLAGRLAAPMPVLCLDSQWQALDAYGEQALPALAGPRNLAYVIYTSGSTGRPKGVGLEHGGVVNRLQWMQDAYRLSPEDRVMQKTPFSFDVSVWEFFWPLLQGARLVLARPEGHLDPHYLAGLVAREGITTMHFVPPMLEVFLATADLAQCATLRQVICSGQALPLELSRRFFAALPAAGLHNLYGPTEASIDVSHHSCSPDSALACVPIGRPIWNTALYVLDARLAPAPVGVAGELHIGGVGLARAYLNRPGLTAEKFIPNPFGAPGSRLYKTGDLARLLADGSIEYLGRLDHQVKIRGLRIELGEIEAALRAQPRVREAVVLARTDAPGDARLVAYVAGQEPQREALKLALQASLPAYMLPSAWVILDELPLTPNGKVDRKALPAPDAELAQNAYEAPRNDTERTLSAIWAGILKIGQVGIRDNFFELGGHSLLVVQMLSALQAAGWNVDVSAVYGAPTLADLAATLDAAASAAAPAPFRAPPNLIPAASARITPDMLTLVELTQDEIDRVVDSVPGGAPNVQDIYPLAPAQEGVYFYHLLHRGSDPYVMPMLFTVGSQARFDVLLEALRAVIARHDALRTGIVSAGLRAPVQVVQRQVAPQVTMIELADGDDAIAELEARCSGALDLTRAPMLEICAARTAQAPTIHVLFRIHHLIDDVASSILLGAEVRAHLRGIAAELPQPVQYREFVAHALHQASEGSAERFFRGMLGDVSEPTAPFDLRDVHGDGADIAEYRKPLDPALAAAIRQAARQRKTSPAALFHAAWALVVGACSARDDVVFGTVFSGRLQHMAGAGSMLGMFINTLPMRVRLADVGVAQLLDRTEAALRELLPYERSPLALAQRCSGLDSGETLFSAILNYRHNAAAPDHDPEADGDIVLIGFKERTNYPLTLSVDDLDDGFVIDAQVQRGQVPERILAYLEQALAGIVEALREQPHKAALQVALLPEDEREQLLVAWNRTAHAYEHEQTLHGLFEEQARRTPAAVAAVFEGESLTYAELDARSNRLAAYLRDQGVGAESLVAVCLERSLEMVVALLGILKAGGAYAPLDPGYPRERLAHMLEDAAPAVLLTQASLAGRLAAPMPVLCLDSQWQALDAYGEQALPALAGPRNLAYVIYTSGSTGRPKGVGLEHGGVVNRLQWMQDAYRLSPEDRVMQKTPFSFDVSVWEFFWPLLQGARLVLARPEGHLDPHYLAGLVAREGITTMHFVPPMLEVFLATADLAQCATLRQVACSGQALPPDLAQRFLEALPGVRLHNQYGPTEAGEMSALECLPGENLESMPIGRPIWNTELYVLDRQLQPVPQGVPGELHIAGHCLARAYANRPGLTAGKFIPNPFGAPGTRMYKTGDLARFLADGSVEYLGRIDDQVKIRGLRIELGEIEVALRDQPGVRDAVVLARTDAPGDSRLAAYVVGDGLDVDALGQALQARLPAYMLPSAWMVLEALPLTPNGKVDRKALPAPQAAAQAGYVAPSTSTEAALAAIWAELLQREPGTIGAHDNFFALGGHSLLAVRLVAAVRSALGVELAIRVLFAHASLAALAAAVDTGAGGAVRPRVTARERGGPPPASFAQQRLWFLDQLEGGSAHYNMPAALRVRGRFDPALAAQALGRIFARHEPLRTVFARDGEQLVQVIREQVDVGVPVVDLAHLPQAERERAARELALADAAAPFDLAHDPMLRASYVRLGEDEGMLLFNMHHIASDGWSMGLLVREFTAQYQALRSGSPDPFGPLAVTYADYAQWQRDYLAGPVLQEQLGYWETQLAGLPPVHSLPLDRPRPPQQGFRGARHRFTLDRDLHAGLRRLAQERGATLFMVLHAALSVLLARHGNSADIVVGTPVANRLQKELEEIIGFFVNTLVLRTDVSGNPRFDAFLDQVKAVNLDAQSRQDVPFEYLVERLNPARSTQYGPLFQIMFNMGVDEAGTVAAASMDELRFSPEVAQAVPARFELSFNASEGEEGLRMSIDYNVDLFDAATVERLAAHYARLLAAIVAAPATPVQDLPLLDEDERHYLLHTLNATAAGYPDRQCIHELFEEQAARTPDHMAFVYEGQALSYRELNERANQLAHYLRARGVGRGSLVGLCVERSLEMPIGLLGILKAGGAYMPLDPAYPAERLRYMLEDARPAMLLTASSLASAPVYGGPVLCLDSQWAMLAGGPTTNPARLATPSDLAYVIYTSGSTGGAKGVMIEHRSAVNFWQVMCRSTHQPCGAAARIALNASYAFDMSLKGWLQLLSGHTVYLIPQAIRADGKALMAYFEQHRIDAFDSTPSQLEALIAGGLLDNPRWHPRSVLLGGEAISPTMWRKLQQASDIAFFNMYGPTECTVDASLSRIFPEDAGAHVGRPVANARIYLLDREGRLQPDGVAGEIHIGGLGVARGYLNRPALTAEKFIPDPYGPPGSRLYRTGDLGRLLPDGRIEYLTRLDQQVKIRGFRVELGEIEAALRAQPAVRDVVVVAREAAPGDLRLVAYVAGEGIDRIVLKLGLQARLPDYMVPSAWVVLESLPLTANGKVDRKALPAADPDIWQLEYVAPRTDTEAKLVGIWSELLNLPADQVSTTADFFSLGGHSLLAVRLIAAIGDAFEIRLEIKRLFEQTNIVQIGAIVDEIREMSRISQHFEAMSGDGVSEVEI